MAGRPKSPNKMTVIASTRLSNEQSKYVSHYAKEHGISFSSAIRTIIDQSKNQDISTGGNHLNG